MTPKVHKDTNKLSECSKTTVSLLLQKITTFSLVKLLIHVIHHSINDKFRHFFEVYIHQNQLAIPLEPEEVGISSRAHEVEFELECNQLRE